MATKKRSMVEPSTGDPIDIDALIGSANGSTFELDSPTRDGVKIKLELLEFSGEDILNNTTVLGDNERSQRWLTETSLGPLISAFKLSRGQSVPALGTLNDDGSVTVAAGSRRRMAAYFSGYPYKVLAGKDLSIDDARIITKVENVNSPISLIERGERWAAIQAENNLSYREIANEVERGLVSHTYIAIGISGFKLPDDIKALYPSLNCINRRVIGHLKKSLEAKGADEICDYIKGEHADVVASIAKEYAENSAVNCEKLTNLIVAYCSQKPLPKKAVWPSTLSLTESADNEVSEIKFNKPLTKSQAEKLKVFLSSLMNKG
ncbi:hypothetical protein [Pseudoalteromonas nigrifaciens]|uniref:hypothetical protein n=1 Tax=Pseudoalteromonas nigrifaciens TaxID=28109 RepID=UPI003FD3F239